jgi:hypothetical protein
MAWQSNKSRSRTKTRWMLGISSHETIERFRVGINSQQLRQISRFQILLFSLDLNWKVISFDETHRVTSLVLNLINSVSFSRITPWPWLRGKSYHVFSSLISTVASGIRKCTNCGVEVGRPSLQGRVFLYLQ